jgi:hypothetical protein
MCKKSVIWCLYGKRVISSKYYLKVSKTERLSFHLLLSDYVELSSTLLFQFYWPRKPFITIRFSKSFFNTKYLCLFVGLILVFIQLIIIFNLSRELDYMLNK